MLADVARRFGRKSVVTQVVPLSPGLLRLDLTGPELVGRAWHPGGSVEFLVTRQHMRHYTPLSFDPATGSCSIIIQLHSDGPGTAWAQELSTGDETLMFGPGGRPWPKPTPVTLMLGDATAIGLFRGLLDSCPPGTTTLGAIEVPAADALATKALVPELEVLELTEPGAALRDWTTRLSATPGICYLAGHAQSLNEVRKDLLSGTHERPALTRKAITVQAFWATGKTGL
jgi:NADPH-dependent ferric siderophore reductase